jgi:hypothetical protein
MEVHFTPDMEAKLNEFAAATGRAKDDLLQDAMTGYFDELNELRGMLDNRYDDLASGSVKPIDGEEARTLLKGKTEAQRNRRP